MKIAVQNLCSAYCKPAAAGCCKRNGMCLLPYAAAHSVLCDHSEVMLLFLTV